MGKYPWMGRNGLMRSVWLRTGKQFTQDECGLIIDAVFDAIFDELEAHGTVVIPHFGTFYVEDLKGRTYYDTFNGKTNEKPTRAYPKFRASDRLKEYVAQTISFRNRDL